MFTGLVEEVGVIEEMEPHEGGRRIVVSGPVVSTDLSIGDSVNVSGCCQTVVDVGSGVFSVIAVPETLRRTHLGALVEGDSVNLERSVRLMDRIGGHLVQGHVDAVGRVRTVREEPPGWWLDVEAGPEVLRYLAFKGSVAVDGTSLTVARLDEDAFSVAIVPHTWQATVCRLYRPGSEVNLEVDLIARYLERLVLEAR
jgi:riboflavin synthase